MSIEHKEGLLFFGDVQCTLKQMSIFLCMLFKVNESETPKKAREILRSSSIDDVKFFLGKFSPKVLKNYKLGQFLLFLNNLGFGKTSLKRYSANRVDFLLSNSVMNSLYINFFDKSPEVYPEEIVSGFVGNLIELLEGRKCDIEMKKLNNKTFSITIFISDKEINVDLNSEKYDSVKKTLSKNMDLRKIISGAHIRVIEGNLRLWNTYGLLIPIFFFMNFFTQLENKKYELFFTSLGLALGHLIVDFQRKYFGVRDSDLFHKIISHTEIAGTGEIKILNEEPMVYVYENNFSNYKKFMVEDLFLYRLYLNNIIRGVYNASFNLSTKYLEEDTLSVKLLKIKEGIQVESEEEDFLFNLLKVKNVIFKIQF